MYDDLYAADQIAVNALALSEYVSSVSRVGQPDGESNSIPTLTNNPDGSNWLVTQINGSLGTARLWEMLLNPATFESE